jgi:hypothetical protein
VVPHSVHPINLILFQALALLAASTVFVLFFLRRVTVLRAEPALAFAIANETSPYHKQSSEKGEQRAIGCEIAFHEKAGRSQVDSDLASLNKFLFLPAEWPLSPCFHPHSRGANRFARCMLGVLVSAGAAICLATSRFT